MNIYSFLSAPTAGCPAFFYVSHFAGRHSLFQKQLHNCVRFSFLQIVGQFTIHCSHMRSHFVLTALYFHQMILNAMRVKLKEKKSCVYQNKGFFFNFSINQWLTTEYSRLRISLSNHCILLTTTEAFYEEYKNWQKQQKAKQKTTHSELLELP